MQDVWFKIGEYPVHLSRKIQANRGIQNLPPQLDSGDWHTVHRAVGSGYPALVVVGYDPCFAVFLDGVALQNIT
jgi:hypothetical protein